MRYLTKPCRRSRVNDPVEESFVDDAHIENYFEEMDEADIYRKLALKLTHIQKSGINVPVVIKFDRYWTSEYLLELDDENKCINGKAICDNVVAEFKEVTIRPDGHIETGSGSSRLRYWVEVSFEIFKEKRKMVNAYVCFFVCYIIEIIDV